MKLEFNNLYGGVLNAVVRIKEGVRLSVSKGRFSTGSYVGEDESYEAAIQVNDGVSPYWDMVKLPNGDTIKSGCNSVDLMHLQEWGKGINLLYNIYIVDDNQWKYRFTVTDAKGDEDAKIDYANRIWKSEWKKVPLENRH